MKVATINIRHGGGAAGSDRPGRLVRHLIESDADVIVLTEARQSSGTTEILARLEDMGWVHQALDHLLPRKNGTALVSRRPIDIIDMGRRRAIDPYRFVEALVDGVYVTGVYLPLGKDKLPYFRALRRLLSHRASTGEAHLVIGDLNTGDDIDAEGMPFILGDEFRTLTESGYVDAWRSGHPEGREYSWFSHRGNGFRIDHAFVSPALFPRLVEARYDHGPREDGSTDHSLLAVSLA